jgi:HKD family nuclease
VGEEQMQSQIHVLDAQSTDLESVIKSNIIEAHSRCLGLAIAYVSIYGAQFIRRLKKETRLEEIRLIADVSDAVSHPEAFRIALQDRWQVKIVNRASGIFHPKMYVAGAKFKSDGSIQDPHWLMVGSNNLTRGGLINNIECSVLTGLPETAKLAGPAFKTLWSNGNLLKPERLTEYEEYFAKRNRSRTIEDIEAFGLPDALLDQNPSKKSPSGTAVISLKAASTAWVGLRSSTGGYRFQIEFPKKIGEVFKEIIRASGAAREILVLCEDGQIRRMTYDYYENAMYRLNVPNDVPGVEDARSLHNGVGLIEKIDGPGASFRFRIIREQVAINELIARSRAFGTLGQTSTRSYGWF